MISREEEPIRNRVEPSSERVIQLTTKGDFIKEDIKLLRQIVVSVNADFERVHKAIPGPPPIQWTRKCLSFSSVPHPRWSQKLPLRQRRRGVEGSSIPRSSDEPQWSEGPKCSRRLRVLRFEVDRRLIAQR